MPFRIEKALAFSPYKIDCSVKRFQILRNKRFFYVYKTNTVSLQNTTVLFSCNSNVSYAYIPVLIGMLYILSNSFLFIFKTGLNI